MGKAQKVELPKSRPYTRARKSEEQFEASITTWTKEKWLSASFWDHEDIDLYPHLKANGVWHASFLNLSLDNLKILTTGILEKEGRFAKQQGQPLSAKQVAAPDEVKAVLESLQTQLKALESQNSLLSYRIQENEKLLSDYQRSLEFTQAALDSTTQTVTALQAEVKQHQQAQSHNQTPSNQLKPTQPNYVPSHTPRKDRTLYVTGLDLNPSQSPAEAVDLLLSSIFPTVPTIIEEVVLLPAQRHSLPEDQPRPARCFVIMNNTDMVDRIMRSAFVLKDINARRQEMQPQLPRIRIDRQLSYQERQERSRLWPVFRAARASNQKAFWKGAVLYIDNKPYVTSAPPPVCSGIPGEITISE